MSALPDVVATHRFAVIDTETTGLEPGSCRLLQVAVVLATGDGTIDGVIGLAAHVHAAAAMPHNYIALEYPYTSDAWWYDIVEGLPTPIVKNSMIDVAAFDRPGLGVKFNIDKALTHLAPDDAGFFD